METTLNTSAELLRQIGYLADDENSLKKLLAYTKKLVSKKKEAEEEPVQTKEEILSDFAEACRELKPHREDRTTNVGRIKKRIARADESMRTIKFHHRLHRF